LSPPELLLLKDAPSKGPVIKLPKDTKLLPTKPNETLTGMKYDKHGQIIYAKYVSHAPRITIEGVRAHPPKVKFLPSKETPMKTPPPPKHRKTTVSDLEKQVAHLTKIVNAVEESHALLGKTVRTMNDRLDLTRIKYKKLAAQVENLPNEIQGKHPN
jgi:hypothetical protein